MEEKIGIITDSTCDIPAELIEQHGIEVVPLRIIYANRECRDGIEITPEEVYNTLDDEVPTTSLPLPEDVEAVFAKMKQKGFTHILSIHLSSGLSGTGQMMETMANQAKDLVVKVIDSKSISMGLGLMVIEAAKAAEKEMSFEAICQHLSSVRERISVFFVLGTLEYLKRGGRIGRVSGTLGQILNIKPIITVTPEGIYTTYAKVRGRNQSIERMFTIVKEHLAKAASTVAVCYGGAQEEAITLAKKIEKLPNLTQLFVSNVSPVIGVHTGPGTLGFAILTNTEDDHQAP